MIAVEMMIKPFMIWNMLAATMVRPKNIKKVVQRSNREGIISHSTLKVYLDPSRDCSCSFLKNNWYTIRHIVFPMNINNDYVNGCLHCIITPSISVNYEF